MKAYLALAASLTTLLCCVLPTILVFFGFGALVVAIVGHLPWLVTLSESSAAVQFSAGLIIALSGLALWRQAHAPCPVDPALRMACLNGRKWSKRVWFVSLLIFAASLAVNISATLMVSSA